jgi:hypothetical protein
MASIRPWQDKNYLYDAYVTRRKTIYEIADECTSAGHKVTPMTIFNNLKKFDLIKNSRNLGKRSVGGNNSGKKRGGFY